MSSSLSAPGPVAGLVPSQIHLKGIHVSTLSPKQVFIKHFVVSSTNADKLQPVFASASIELEQMNHTVSLKFVSSEEDPSPSLAREALPFWSDFEEDQTAGPGTVKTSAFLFWEGRGNQNRALAKERDENVKRVLVNLCIPPATQRLDIDAKWRALASVIGSLCRSAFPNLDPKESALIVHQGFERYHNDEAFLVERPLQTYKLLNFNL